MYMHVGEETAHTGLGGDELLAGLWGVAGEALPMQQLDEDLSNKLYNS